MQAKSRLLWVIPKWPIPAIDGARVATQRLLENVILSGAEIDIFCLATAKEQIDIELIKKKWKVKSTYILRRKIPESNVKKYLYYLKSFIQNPLMPITFASFFDKSIQQNVEQLLSKKYYKYIIFDGLHLTSLFYKNKRFIKNKHIKYYIYRAHNIESDLWVKASSKAQNIFFKLFLKFQSILVLKFEKLILSNMDGVAPISIEDQKSIELMDKNCNTFLTPLGLNFNQAFQLPKSNSINFLFVGRLDWAPNRDGLKWFLNEVWSKALLNRPNMTLSIVGSGDKSWLSDYQHLTNIKILGFVENLDSVYLNCHYTIAPIFFGSGTRIKVLESYVYGRMIISNTMGVQGAGLNEKDYHNAGSKEEWIKLISTVKISNKELQQIKITRKKLSQNFDQKEVANNFYSWLKTFE